MRAFRCLACSKRALIYYGPDFGGQLARVGRVAVHNVREAINYAMRARVS